MLSAEKSVNIMNYQSTTKTQMINLQEIPINYQNREFFCYSLGAICVLPASIVMWVGNFSDFARSCQSK
jgi:hypothetical protein